MIIIAMMFDSRIIVENVIMNDVLILLYKADGNKCANSLFKSQHLYTLANSGYHGTREKEIVYNSMRIYVVTTENIEIRINQHLEAFKKMPH